MGNSELGFSNLCSGARLSKQMERFTRKVLFQDHPFPYCLNPAMHLF